MSGNKTICVALDLSKTSEILGMIRLLGDELDMVKLHCDIIEDFDDAFIEELVALKRHHHFRIWEDRKFADIGYIAERQIKNSVFKIEKWADIVSFHAVAGLGSIPKDIGNLSVFLVVEMSNSGNLCGPEYIRRATEIANSNPNITGIVAQHRPDNLGCDKLVISPGVNLTGVTGDKIDQQYDTIENKMFADVYVIGRAITQAEDPKAIFRQLNETIKGTKQN